VADYAGFAAQNSFGIGFDPTAYPPQGYAQGYPQAGGYQQGYPQAGGYPQGYGAGEAQQPVYAQGFDPSAYGRDSYGQQGYGSFPTGYQPAWSAYRAGGERGAFLGALGNLPRVLVGMFRDVGDTLQGMMERSDVFTGGLVAGLSLLFTFLAAMVMTRGAIAMAFNGLSSLFGISLAGDAASMSQGVSYIAGKIAAPIGGIAALCQLFALVLPAAVVLTYLCAIRQVRFSYLLASNVVAVTTLPSIAAALLCMVFSLLSPVLGVLMLALGEVASYVLVCLLIAHITGLAEQHSALVKLAVVCISIVVKMLFIQLVGGSLMASVMRTLTALMSTMGSLL
jgi:hypothetical protein